MCILNEEACLSEREEEIWNNMKVVRLILGRIYLDQMLGAEIKQAYTSLKMAAELKVWEAKLYPKSYASLYN